jgi:hypothetical protein
MSKKKHKVIEGHNIRTDISITTTTRTTTEITVLDLFIEMAVRKELIARGCDFGPNTSLEFRVRENWLFGAVLTGEEEGPATEPPPSDRATDDVARAAALDAYAAYDAARAVYVAAAAAYERAAPTGDPE